MPCSHCGSTFSALHKLKQYELLSRVRLNHAPVASERTEFAKLISHAERDLMGYGEAIAQLQEIIVALKNEQRILNRQVRLAKSLMSPIRQLPPEILHQIFIAHGVRNVIRLDKAAKCCVPGFRIASICSHWRSIALDTTALWNDITVEVRDNIKYDARLPLTERLLALSRKSSLTLDIDVDSPTEAVTSTIPLFDLLCTHANRWQRLYGSFDSSGHGLQTSLPVIDMLASMQGRLDRLHTFRLLISFEHCSRWVQGAPKLHTFSILHLNNKSTTIPWNQIVNLNARESRVLRIAESLRKMPNLSSLDVTYLHRCRTDDGTVKAVAHSNLKSLKIIITDAEDETEMRILFQSLTLPQLQSLYIQAQNDYLTSQHGQAWSSLDLPSLISRSSILITSFSLNRVWMDTSDLISLLRLLPALTFLFLSESYGGSDTVSPMINNQFLSSMYMQHQDQQPILTRLTSLNLDLGPQAESFSFPTFVDMIHSRWKPAYLDDNEVACIKTVRLFALEFAIVPNTVDSLMVLRKRGLDITIKDVNGPVIFESELAE